VAVALGDGMQVPGRGETMCDRTTIRVVGCDRLHKSSWKSSSAEAQLPERTGENRA